MMLADKTVKLLVIRTPLELLKSQVLNMFRLAIQAGEFRPGVRIIEGELAKRMVKNQVPIREALHILEGEGLVISTPWRGTHVIDLTDKNIKEIFSLRTLSELHAIDNLNLSDEKGYLEKLQDIIN